MNETSARDAVHIAAIAAANATIDSCYEATNAALAARDSLYDAYRDALDADDRDKLRCILRAAYNDALDKAYVAAGKAFDAAGNDTYSDARDEFAAAYAELDYARCAYAAALDAGYPAIATEDNPK